jgi:hypothetical protein
VDREPDHRERSEQARQHRPGERWAAQHSQVQHRVRAALLTPDEHHRDHQARHDRSDPGHVGAVRSDLLNAPDDR